uniref:Holotricin-3-like n=1 Tax=Panagrellus redivivus TaxID=6233 RepID=A0A7E4WBP6_PANRE
MSKATIAAVSFALFAAVIAHPYGDVYGHHGDEWHAPAHYATHGSHGSGYGAGHDAADDWANKHGSKWGHDNAHVGGDAAGFAKGQKSDWANYQYGGEGNRAEGDAWAKSYGNAFGDGHDAGAAAGGRLGHGDAHGQGWAGHNAWGHGDLHHGHGHGGVYGGHF